MEKKPNIVIIMTDQQRADLRKKEGFPCDTMPFLDRLAATGCEFRRAYTSAPICMPARNSLFTGRFPSALRTVSNQSYNEDIFYRKDLIDILREEGYRVGLSGKNHSYVSPDRFDYFNPFDHSGGAGDARTGIEKEFDDYLRELRHRTSHRPTPFPLEAQCPYRIVDGATRWIGSSDGRPFFLWLSFPEPHNPYQVPEPYFSLFRNAPPPDTDARDLDKKGFKYRWLRRAWERVVPELEADISRGRKNYLGMLRLIDDQLQRFYAALERKGLLEDTVLIFLSDHGEFAGEFGLERKGAELAEQLCRIPLVITGPGVRSGTEVSESFVSLVDIFPTICDILGKTIPEGCQGRSLLPMLKGEAYPEEEFASVYVEHGFGGHYFDGNENLSLEQEGALNPYCTFDCLNTWTQAGTARAVRWGDYKLIADMVGDTRLYDIRTDPYELEDLSAHPSQQGALAGMMRHLIRWQMRASDDVLFSQKRYYFKRHDKNYLWGTAGDDRFSLIPPRER